MKVVVIGATGFVGSKIVSELVSRGHEVVGVSRKDISPQERVTYKNVDVNEVSELSELIKGNDAVVSAFNAGWTNPDLYKDFLEGSKNIEKAVEQSGVKRFVVIGGAGSLYTPDHVQIVDTPDFPKEIYPGANASREYLNEIKSNQQLDWTFFSPAIEMHQGTSGIRKGTYRTSLETPVFNEEGRSVLSVEDVAVAITDELEKPQFIHKRFTAGY